MVTTCKPCFILSFTAFQIELILELITFRISEPSDAFADHMILIIFYELDPFLPPKDPVEALHCPLVFRSCLTKTSIILFCFYYHRKGMIAWIAQGLEKVVPQPELTKKETPTVEQPAEVHQLFLQDVLQRDKVEKYNDFIREQWTCHTSAQLLIHFQFSVYFPIKDFHHDNEVIWTYSICSVHIDWNPPA